MKRLGSLIFWIFILIFLTSTTLYSEPKNLLSVNAVPLGTVPLGSSADLFKMGYGMELSASYMPASFNNFGFRLGSNFIILPLATTDSIWVLSGSAGPAFMLHVGKKLTVSAYGTAGYYYFNTVGWDAAGGTGGDFVYSGGAGGTYQLADRWALGLGVFYDYYSSLYNGLGISISARMDVPLTARARPVREQKPKEVRPQLLNEKGKGVELRDITLSPLFPVLYKFYDSNSVGTVRVKNFEKKKAEDITLRFL